MKVLAFGDSFVKMFLHCEPQVKHWKFKGKSVRGLVKEEDLQRRKIERQVRKTSNGTKILLLFGQVDFNYVRYYKIIKGQPPISEQTFKKYVEWVSTMNRNKNVSIISIFPTPIKKQNLISSLINKGSYLLQERTSEIDEKILSQFQKSSETWYQWNSWINKYCEKYSVNNIRLFKQNFLQPEFYDISRLTIHLRYVPVLKLVQKHINISFDVAKAQQIQKKYQEQKIDRVVHSILFFDGIVQKSQDLAKEVQDKLQLVKNVSLQEQNKPISEVQQMISSQNQQVQIESPQQISVPQKNERKHTADLDTDTNLEKQSEKSKQADLVIQKELQKIKVVNTRSSSSSEKTKQLPKVNNNTNQKKTKNKKQKKKYVQIQKDQNSEDEAQQFFQLSKKSKRNY